MSAFYISLLTMKSAIAFGTVYANEQLYLDYLATILITVVIRCATAHMHRVPTVPNLNISIVLCSQRRRQAGMALAHRMQVSLAKSFKRIFFREFKTVQNYGYRAPT
jgi:hypothetical protein